MIYVDELKACRPTDSAPEGCVARWRASHYARLFSDDLNALHAAAGALGLKPEYFKDIPRFPHYQVTRVKRNLAVKNGAAQVTGDFFFRFCTDRQFRDGLARRDWRK